MGADLGLVFWDGMGNGVRWDGGRFFILLFVVISFVGR